MRTEQKIVVWDYRKKSNIIIWEDDDYVDTIWPNPDWKRLIEEGLPRNVAYWQALIRKGIIKGMMIGGAITQSSSRPIDEYCKLVRLAEKVKNEAVSCETLDSIMKIVDRGRAISSPSAFKDNKNPDKITELERCIYGCIGEICSDKWGSEEEMYSEKFAVSEKVVREYADSRFLVINNSELEFTGNTGKSGKYPEVRFINRHGHQTEGLIISPKKGRTIEEYEPGKASVFEFIPAKEERWSSYRIFGKRYLSDASWAHLKPVKINVSTDDAKQIYETKTGELFEKEQNKIFPLTNDPKISKAADMLLQMGFISCTSSYSGDLLEKQLADTGKALAELAQIMALPINAMSGYGKLSIGFAANVTTSRTRGQYSAKTIVIRPNDAGALAHEWYHAMDALYHSSDNIFNKIDLVSNDTGTDYYKRCLETDQKYRKNDVYFSLPYEMSARAFEVFISSNTNDPVLVTPGSYGLPYYPNLDEIKQYKSLFEQMKAMIRKADPNNYKKENSVISGYHVRFESKKYEYFACGEYLLRKDKINRYRGMEYFTGGQWKYLTPELRDMANKTKLKQITSQMELNMFLNG